jgi:AcrR family transcriptional regulator
VTSLDAQPSTAGGLRERHKQSTRRSLEDAALRLFADRGYDATTIEAIADAAGVSPRTFFRYFGAKDEVLDMGWAQRREQLAGLVDAVPPENDDHAAASHVLVAMAEAFEPERDRVLLRARALRSSSALRGRNADTTAAWEQTLAEGLARRRGLAEPDARARAVAAAYTAVWRTALGEWLRSPAPSLPEVVAEAFGHLSSH